MVIGQPGDTLADLGFLVGAGEGHGAGEGNRTLMTSLEGRGPGRRVSSADVCPGGPDGSLVSYRC
jgi:hypothetical protein